MPRGRPYNYDCFWFPEMYNILQAAARQVASYYKWRGDPDELINVAWYRHARHYKSISNAKKYLFLNAKRTIAQWILKEKRYEPAQPLTGN